jgi:hypothetical protein
MDASMDASGDVFRDGSGDASGEMSMDASMDTSMDASRDVSWDAPWDASINRHPSGEALRDVSTNEEGDASRDAFEGVPAGVEGVSTVTVRRGARPLSLPRVASLDVTSLACSFGSLASEPATLSPAGRASAGSGGSRGGSVFGGSDDGGGVPGSPVSVASDALGSRCSAGSAASWLSYPPVTPGSAGHRRNGSSFSAFI